MIGMNRHTGAICEGADHLHQSIALRLTTPLGTRVGRRDYGSLIPALIDQPRNAATRLAIIAAAAMALRDETRLRARQLLLDRDAAGADVLRIVGTRLDGPRPAPIDVTATLRPARA
ncbi:GPW/gp25 family protein [uncultured Sphingomonas sp.]|uniref:GPW/gp25 family protein n=1 Tax=uncultured Sphingomonas sp. TaxID=158754 RepID=UPI0025E9C4A1|nr:GPW/gp25 family protein [uncultured Sphingomonas sp.]